MAYISDNSGRLHAFIIITIIIIPNGYYIVNMFLDFPRLLVFVITTHETA